MKNPITDGGSARPCDLLQAPIRFSSLRALLPLATRPKAVVGSNPECARSTNGWIAAALGLAMTSLGCAT